MARTPILKRCLLPLKCTAIKQSQFLDATALGGVTPPVITTHKQITWKSWWVFGRIESHCPSPHQACSLNSCASWRICYGLTSHLSDVRDSMRRSSMPTWLSPSSPSLKLGPPKAPLLAAAAMLAVASENSCTPATTLPAFRKPGPFKRSVVQ